MALPELPKNYGQCSFLKRSWKHTSTFLNFILRLVASCPNSSVGSAWDGYTWHLIAWLTTLLRRVVQTYAIKESKVCVNYHYSQTNSLSYYDSVRENIARTKPLNISLTHFFNMVRDLISPILFLFSWKTETTFLFTLLFLSPVYLLRII